ncbi:ATP synthase subunit alpha [Nymphon striatum]|nr:ATP synthase subunit alpha [Nymphon striatum]
MTGEHVYRPDKAGLAAAVAAINAGQPIVIPTDTVYGLAVRAGDPAALERVFQLKNRPAERSIAVLVGDLDQASERWNRWRTVPEPFFRAHARTRGWPTRHDQREPQWGVDPDTSPSGCRGTRWPRCGHDRWRPVRGPSVHGGARTVPLLTTLFLFIAIGNLFEVIPFFNMPLNARMAAPLIMALTVWAMFIAASSSCSRSSLPAPLSHAVRLFANMLAALRLARFIRWSHCLHRLRGRRELHPRFRIRNPGRPHTIIVQISTRSRTEIHPRRHPNERCYVTLPIEPLVGLLYFAEEAVEEEGSFNPILPTLPEMIWSGLFFFGLWALMKFVLLPPIIEGRNQREARVRTGQDSVSDSESELAQITAAHEERIAAARSEAAALPLRRQLTKNLEGFEPSLEAVSVSRVGSAAQIKAMKTAVGTLKSDLQQFRELEAFASFGSDLDAVSQAQLDRGYRLTELLKQGVNSPMPVERQVVSLYAGTNGHLDSIPVTDVNRFESELLEYVGTRHSALYDGIKSSGNVDTDELESIVSAFVAQFESSAPAAGDAPEAEAQAAARTGMVDSDVTLPETDIARPEEG